MKTFLRTFATLALEKLAEKSTWAGLAVLAASAGIYVAPEYALLLGGLGTAVAGMALVAMKETP